MRSYSKYFALLLAVITLSIISVNAQDASDKRSGRTIEQSVRRQILKMPRYEVFDYIGYDVNGSTVTLYGKVYNAVNKSTAENSVEDIPGVSRVINKIEVLPPSPFDDTIRRDLYGSISRTAGLSRYLWPVNPSVRLIVDRGRVTLEGYVSNKGDKNLMNIAANGVSNVFSVTNNLKVDSGKAG
ncbi:MAG: BON domain-containing protein [Acidobacteria bacterium]|nr:BON domain-containing protein [Acidobacteriota bacterium]